jgi:hypothetical protein
VSNHSSLYLKPARPRKCPGKPRPVANAVIAEKDSSGSLILVDYGYKCVCRIQNHSPYICNLKAWRSPKCSLETDVSCTRIDRIVAPSGQHEAPIHHARDPCDTTIAHSISPEIVNSNDGRAEDDGADKCSRPFVFDVFAEVNDGLVNDNQPPAKLQCRASSAASSVLPKKAWIPPVVESPHDIGLYADLNREEEILDDNEWQAQHIVGE